MGWLRHDRVSSCAAATLVVRGGTLIVTAGARAGRDRTGRRWPAAGAGERRRPG
jgi:hypothetical protein